jgi:hypothetical protein
LNSISHLKLKWWILGWDFLVMQSRVNDIPLCIEIPIGIDIFATQPLDEITVKEVET